MRRTVFPWLLIPVLVVPSTPVAAQDSTPPAESGITLGAGVGLSTETHFFTVQLARHLPGADWIARYSRAFEYEIFSDTDEVSEFALLRGRRTDSDQSWRRFALGLAVDRLTAQEEDNSGPCGLFGCPIDEEVSWGAGIVGQFDAGRDFGPIGIGLTAQASLNTVRPFAAAAIVLTLGPTSLHR